VPNSPGLDPQPNPAPLLRAQKFGAELGLGGSLEWNDGAQALHAEVLGATSFQGSYAVKGTVGLTADF
jgi:hypothetical protein